jgi:hypothetical protein
MGNPYIQAGLAVAEFRAVTGVDPGPAPGAGRLALFQNAPNPFRRSTVLPYRLAAPGPVSLVLYDVLGRPVRTLVQGVQAAGAHETVLDGEGLPSGVYYYELAQNGQQVGRRCVLVR